MGLAGKHDGILSLSAAAMCQRRTDLLAWCSLLTSADFSPGHTPPPLSAFLATLFQVAFNILIYC